MSALRERVRSVFSAQGELAAELGDLRARGGQLDMALAVADTLEDGAVLAAEAGTGVGKTLAYLVPLLLSGRSAMLSTSTQALQEQLAWRDIPQLSRALGLPVKVVLLKGRGSYLCLHRLGLARQTALSLRADPALGSALEQVHRWSCQTVHGDLAELSGLDERSALLPWISSTRDNCLGADCPSASDCHANRARRAASLADWVVINHHVFVADQAEVALWPRLPAAAVVVFDEAHKLAEVARDLLAPAVGQSDLLALARDIAAQASLWARGQQPWALLALGLERACQAVARLAPPCLPQSRWQGGTPEGLEDSAWTAAIGQVEQALSAAAWALRATADAAPDLRRLLARCKSLAADWAALTRPMSSDAVPAAARWIHWGGAWRLQRAPLDDALLRQALRAMHDQPGRSWVFTSSTLCHDPALSGFTARLGLADAQRLRSLRVSSPFDHASQSALYVPADLPEPGQDGHAEALADHVALWASRLGGHTWVLCTSLRAVTRIATRLRARFAQEPGACRTWGVDGENWPQRGQFLPDLQPHSPAMGQKGGEKCTAAVGLQPTLPKSDRLLEPLPPEAAARIPDSQAIAGAHDVAWVWLGTPTRRYPHGALGSPVHAASVSARVRSSSGAWQTVEHTLPLNRVYEDRVPRLVDLDRDGRDEMVLIEADALRGAALVVLGVDALPEGPRLVERARSPFVGSSFRWLNPVGAADFDGDGQLDLASVTTPHIGGVLLLHHYRPPALLPFAKALDVSNHRMGALEQELAAIVPGAPAPTAARATIILPDMTRRALHALRWDAPGQWTRTTHAVPLPERVERLTARPGGACAELASGTSLRVLLTP